MSSVVIAGRYRIVGLLGQGASAQVFRADDQWMGDRSVVVKVLRQSDAALRAALLREFALMYRLRHPHIAVVVDRGTLDVGLHGIAPGAPFVVQQWCGGTVSQEWVAGRAVSECAYVAAEVAAALATLHALQLCHRDVKPGNVLVADGPHATLIDFGLACRIGEVAPVAGTPRFMAPEALGGTASAAGDIYGLGATLFAWLSGKVPEGALGAQLVGTPLADVIAAMTHANATQRPSAAQVFDLLLPYMQADGRARLEALRDAGVTAQGFFGQDAVRARLAALLSRREGAQVLRIGGTSGAGKTAALAEAAALAALHDVPNPGPVRPAGNGALTAIEAALAELGPSGGREAASDPTEAFWRQCSLLAERLRGVGRVALLFDEVPAGSPLDRFGAFLERMGSAGPPVVWVQTAERGDVALEPLTPDDIRLAIGCARPLRPADQAAAQALHAASGGNPAVVHALLQAHQGDALGRAAKLQQLDLAGSVSTQTDAVLREAPAHCRRLLEYLAILRPPVPLALLREVVDRVEEALRWAHERGLAQPVGGSEPQMALTSGVLRQRLSADLTTASMQCIAEALERQTVDASSGSSPSPHPGARGLGGVGVGSAALGAARESNQQEKYPVACDEELGLLWSRLGRHEQAFPALARAARRAEEELRWADALQLYDATAQLKVAASEREAACLGAARVALVLGQAASALEKARCVQRTTASRRVEGQALLALGRYEEAGPIFAELAGDDLEGSYWAGRAWMLAGKHDKARAALHSPQATAKVRGLAGLVAFYLGDPQRARDELNEALAQATRDGVRDVVGVIQAQRALVLHKSGQASEAEAAYREAIGIAKELRNLPQQAGRLSNLATLLQEQRRFDAALAAYAEAEALARLVEGDREAVRNALNRANLLCWLGDVDTAAPLVDQALVRAEHVGMATEVAYLHLVRAELALLRGDATSACAALDAARERMAVLQDAVGGAECDAVAAEIALFQRDASSVTHFADAAVRAASALGRPRIVLQAGQWHALSGLDGGGLAALQAAERVARVADDDRDPHAGWIAHAVLARLLAGSDRDLEAGFHLSKARQLASVARAEIGGRFEPKYPRVWYRRELWGFARATTEAADPPTRNLDRLFAINRELARDRDPDRLLERVIDAAIALSGADRGFIVLAPDAATMPAEDHLIIRAARNLDRQSLAADELELSRSIALSAMRSQSPVTSLDAQGDARFDAALSVHQLKLRSVLCLPLRTQDGVLGALYLDNRQRVNAFSAADVQLLSAFGDQAAIALANARLVHDLEGQSVELERSRRAIEELNARLERELQARTEELLHVRPEPTDGVARHGMLGASRAMQAVYKVIDRVADRDVPVTILGESGTGKELVARAIHRASQRAGAFVSINCGAIPGELLESELFGHERGAFTGAVRSKPGLFEVAHGGTVFLDEIGEMPLAMQVKLLRVLQQREYRRVGGTRALTTDARVLAASNRDLEAMVRTGTFREDLWYRLNVVEVRLPPLRERRDDLPELIRHFLQQHGAAKPPRLTRDAYAMLLDHAWPGNVRELENEMLRAVALADGEIDGRVLSPRLQKSPVASTGQGGPVVVGSLKTTVEAYERAAIVQVLGVCEGRVAAAAERLGLTRAGLYKKIHKYDIDVDGGRQ